MFTDSVVNEAVPVPSVGAVVVPLSELAESFRVTVVPVTTLPNLSLASRLTGLRVEPASVLFGWVANARVVAAAAVIVNGLESVLMEPTLRSACSCRRCSRTRC